LIILKQSMLKNEKEKFFLFAIIILIIAGLLIWQGIIGISADINNSISELKDKKVSINVYNLKGKSLELEREAYNFSKNEIDKINNYFVYASDNDDTEFTSFFGQLDSIATQSAQKEKTLAIDLYQRESVVPKDKKKPSDLKNSASLESNKEDSRLLKLTLRSNFESLLKFISYLEAMPYYVYIESVNINIDGGAGARKKMNEDVLTSNSPDLQTVLIIKVFRKTNIL